MPSKQPIPQSTKDVLAKLKELQHFGASPSFAELAAACGFKSRNSIRWHLDRAKLAGWVEWNPRKTRSFKVL